VNEPHDANRSADASPVPTDSLAGEAACSSNLDRSCGDHAATRTFAPNLDPHATLGRTTDAVPGIADNEVLARLAPATRPDGLGRLGHYEILQVLGRGGFGIVFRAFDETLQRDVAVKTMSAQLAATPSARLRFLREARTAARVRHDHVVQIYAVEEQPIPYLVMEYIPGLTLQQKLDAAGPLQTEEMLHLALQITRGLAASHAQGLIHRDIKPGNILLESGMEPHAKLTDFGLARAADDASLSQAGMIAGTPMYMAPEQAEGKMIDQRADLFSLGSVFYVMLSGSPPFRGSGTMAVLKRVCEETPPAIRDIVPTVPEWLCNIVAKLHAKKPEDRFATARDVADLLAQHLAHLQQPQKVPMHAPVAVPTVDPGVARGGRKGRRRRTALVAAAGLLLLAAGIPIVYFATRADDSPPQRPQEDDPLILNASDEFFDGLQRKSIHPDLLALAGGGDPHQAPPELVAMIADAHTVRVRSVAVSPDGRVIVSGGDDRTVKVWDLANPRPDGTIPLLHTLTGHAGMIESVTISPDGELVASGSDDGTVILWSVSSGKQRYVSKGHAIPWDGQPLAFGRHAGTAAGLAGILAVGQQDGTTRILEVTAGATADGVTPDGELKVTETIFARQHQAAIRAVAFSRDGRLLALSGHDGQILLCDHNGRWLHTFKAPGAVRAVFSADGRLLAGVSDQPDGGLRVWNIATREMVGPIRLSVTNNLVSIAFHPEGRLVGASAHDGTVRFCDPNSAAVFTIGPGPFGVFVDRIAFSPRGGYAVTANENGTISILRVPEPPLPGTPGPPIEVPLPVELAKRSSPVDALKRADIPLALLKEAGAGDAANAPPDLVAVLAPPKPAVPRSAAPVRTIAISPDGKMLASAGAERRINLWNLADAGLRASWIGHDAAVWGLAFSPDNLLLASAGSDGAIRFWETATAKPVRVLHVPGADLCGVAFSPDRTLLASSSRDGAVLLWNLAGGKIQRVLRGHAGLVPRLAFSPDSKLLATAGHDDRRVRLWDVATGWQLREFRGDDNVAAELYETWSAPNWVVLKPAQPRTESGAKVTVEDDRSMVVEPAAEGQTIRCHPGPQPIRAVRIDAGTHDAAPASGTSASGTPLFEEHRIIATGMAAGVRGRFVRLDLPGDNAQFPRHGPDKDRKAINLAELQVFHGGQNIALRKNARQSSSWDDASYGPDRAVDGNTLGDHQANRYAHTALEDNPWWEVDLGSEQAMDRIVLWNRSDLGSRMAHFRIRVLDRSRRVVFEQVVNAAPNPSAELELQTPLVDLKQEAAEQNTPLLVRLPRSARKDAAARYRVSVATHLAEVVIEDSVAFSPDGRFLSVGTDKQRQLWDLTTAAPTLTLQGGGPVAFRPDGRLLATGRSDGTVRFWDVGADAKREKVCPLFKGGAMAIAFTPDGRHLATGNPDGTVYVLRLAERGILADVAHLQRHEIRLFADWAKAIANFKAVPKKLDAVPDGGGEPFAELPSDRALLVGLNVTAGHDPTVITSLQPIFLTQQSYTEGPRVGDPLGRSFSVVARPGYAVGDIVAKAGVAMDGFKLVFMRIKGARLDPRDRYESPWLGGRGGAPETSLGGASSPIIGIHGALVEYHGTHVPRRLGLVQLDLEAPTK
jgi:WD40 repeat protein